MIRSTKNLLLKFIYKSSFAYNRYLKLKGKLPKEPVGEMPSCAVMQSAEDWKQALKYINNANLDAYDTFPPKNWDSYIALKTLRANTDNKSKILDAGGELYSMILPWLFGYAYRDLTAINLSFKKAQKYKGVKYLPGDITKTGFKDNYFDAITCLSVIEHGVDVRLFCSEMARILKPGGVLVVSTDYFETLVDTQGQEAYGVPIHIFSRTEIESLIKLAGDNALELLEPVDLSCSERPVRWERFDLDYTFITLSFRKTH